MAPFRKDKVTHAAKVINRAQTSPPTHDVHASAFTVLGAYQKKAITQRDTICAIQVCGTLG